MSLSRLLFIREAVWLARFAGSLVLFAGMWIRSRRYLRLVAALPALALATAFGWAVLQSHQARSNPALLESILTQARSSFADGQIIQARLLFRRAEQLAPGNRELTMEFAESLFRHGDRPEAYQMLASIAPVRKSGYIPAHRFLSQNPPDGSAVQQDYFRAIHLSHLVSNSAESREERMQLLRLLARYRRFDDAEKLIRNALDRYPEDRLLLAQLKVRANDHSGARRSTEEACEVLKSLVANEPGRVDRRMQLAQGYVYLGQFADAVCSLSDGMSRTSNDVHSVTSTAPTVPQSDSLGSVSELPPEDRELAGTLVNTYFAWMSTLPLMEQSTQRRCLHRMLHGTNSAVETSESEEKASAKTTVAFASTNLKDQLMVAIVDPQFRWIRYAIRGNAEAALGRFSEAEKSFRAALSECPSDPSVNNNLAWILYHRAVSTTAPMTADVRKTTLEEAVVLSQRAVESMPDVASFLETRGQIYAAVGRHQDAVRDLVACQKLGKDSTQIQKTLQSLAPQTQNGPAAGKL